MVWFKVDDHLHDHRKVRKLGKDKLPAMGLWVLAGSWVADETHDGFVPEEIIRRYDPTMRYARRLVAVGLWEEAAGGGDEPGRGFHQWDEHQPTAAQVEARRQAEAERKARWREAKRAEGGQSRQVSRQVSRRDTNGSERPKVVTERSTPTSNPSHDHHEQGLKITADSGTESLADGGLEDGFQSVSPVHEGVSRRDTTRDTPRDSQRDTPRDSQRESRQVSRSSRPDPYLKPSSLIVPTTSRECLTQAGIDDEREIDKILEAVRGENPGIRNEAAYVAKLIDNGDLPGLRQRVTQATASGQRPAKAQAFIDANRHDFDVKDIDRDPAGCKHCALPPSHDIHRSVRTAPGGDAA